MKSATKIKLVVFVLLTLALLGLRHVFNESLKIDRCLDSGGKFNYETEVCITE